MVNGKWTIDVKKNSPIIECFQRKKLGYLKKKIILYLQKKGILVSKSKGLLVGIKNLGVYVEYRLGCKN